ncbi:MAG: hypothetical protein WCE48_09645 [Steroidobacteraceae bacterium]
MDAAVWSTPARIPLPGIEPEIPVSIHQPLEPRLDDRAVGVQKRDFRIVSRAFALRGDRLRVDEAARPADSRKCVAARATVEIEPRAESCAGRLAALDRIQLVERIETFVEQCFLRGAQSR